MRCRCLASRSSAVLHAINMAQWTYADDYRYSRWNVPPAEVPGGTRWQLGEGPHPAWREERAEERTPQSWSLRIITDRSIQAPGQRGSRQCRRLRHRFSLTL